MIIKIKSIFYNKIIMKIMKLKGLYFYNVNLFLIKKLFGFIFAQF